MNLSSDNEGRMFWRGDMTVASVSVCCALDVNASLVKLRTTLVNTFPQLDGNLMGVSLYVTSVVGPI
jgi:hypothetical protein